MVEQRGREGRHGQTSSGAAVGLFFVAVALNLALCLFACLAQGTLGEIYNVGSQRERTVTEVAADICALFQALPDKLVKHVRDRAFQDRR